MSALVVYFEIAGPDVQQLAAFYVRIFGWQSRPGPFPSYLSLGAEVGTERGAGLRQEAAPERVLYVRVDDLQQTLDQVVAAGGKVLIPPTQVPNVVHFALFEDPAGNRMGIVQ
jgi:predicted enzyme related to lactoylglutathione lyase